jgi:hypothetical protein
MLACYKDIVTQEDIFGCGVACTAFILGISYKEAKTFFCANKIKEYGCDCIDICNALGSNYSYFPYTGEVPNNSIVFLGRSKFYNVGHYVVRYNDQWMNPWMYGNSIKEAVGGFCKKLLSDKYEWVIRAMDN